MANLPDIKNELCSAIQYYIKYVEGMGSTGYTEEDADEFVKDWLKVQMRLAWQIYYNNKAK